MTEIFIQLKDAIVVLEAPQGPEFVVDVLRRDGYEARQVGDMVVVKERSNERTVQSLDHG